MCSLSREFENRFLQASDNGIRYDCEFIVGPEKVVVEGHKFLFAVASEVFQAMFYGELKEDNTVEIEDLNAEGFLAMKKFIYSGFVSFTSVIHALTTFTAARKYLMPQLTRICMEYIEYSINPSNVLESYEYCKINNVPEFEELDLNIIENKTDEVVNSEYFPKAKVETIQLILRSRSLRLKSEIEVFNLFEKWALAEAAREQISEGELASHFKNLKMYIRFLTISADEFISHIKESLLLTQAEKRAIENNLLETCSSPMPENLSVVKQKRIFLNTCTPPQPVQPLEIYDYVFTFVVSLKRFCTSCGVMTFNENKVDFKLNLKIENEKYLCLIARPKNCMFKIDIKVSLLAKGGSSLNYKKEYEILSTSPESNVLIAAIPLNEISSKFYQVENSKTLFVKVQFNILGM